MQAQRAALYLRYSSSAQRDTSIEQQRRVCQDFARRGGIAVVAEYSDSAISGTTDQRPGFKRMIADSAKGGWDCVIVYALDRFARDRYDSAVYKRQLRTNGCRLISATEPITDDPAGIILESMLEGMAEYYSKELSQKIKRGMADNASRCLCNGQIPLGYVRGPDGRFAVDPAEAAIVQEIFQRVGDREPLSDIIRDLNARGIRTKKGRDWTKSSLNRILGNERYTGVYIYGNVRTPGGVPVIVSPESWERVQEYLSTKPNPRTAPGAPHRRRRERGTYLLTGKLFCGHCGSAMIGVSGNSAGGVLHHYYACKGRPACHKKNVRRDWIEERLARLLRETMLTDEAIGRIADAAMRSQAQQEQSTDAALLREQLAHVERSINNLVSAIESGTYSDALMSRLKALEAEKIQLARQVAAAESEAADRPTRAQIIAMLRLFQQGDLQDKTYQERLLDMFLIRADLYDDRIRVFFRLSDSTPTDIPLPLDAYPADWDDPDMECSHKGSNAPPMCAIRTSYCTIVVIGAIGCCLARL